MERGVLYGALRGEPQATDCGQPVFQEGLGQALQGSWTNPPQVTAICRSQAE